MTLGCICPSEYQRRDDCPMHGEPEHYIDIETRMERLDAAMRHVQKLDARVLGALNLPGDDQEIVRALMMLEQVRLDLEGAVRCATKRRLG